MIFDRWSVVVVPFPFTDGETTKKRPALVLPAAEFQEQTGHVICGMITSGLHSDWPFDVPLRDYADAGLKKPCKFRGKLFTLHEDLVLYQVGSLSPADRAAIVRMTRALLPA